MEIARELGSNLDEDKVKSVIRLRKRENTNNNRPRLLKVVFDSESCAKELLRAAPRLAEATSNNMKEIKIFRDLCKADKEKRKKLVEEIVRRSEELKAQNVTNVKWIIRGEQLVKVQNRQMNAGANGRPSPKN